MSEEFLSDADRPSVPPHHPETTSRRDRQPVRLMAIGSREAIGLVIHQLHNLKFVEAGLWSEPQPEPKTGQLMSVATKWVRCD